MFFLLSKITAFILSPITWMIFLFIAGRFARPGIRKRRLYFTGLCMLLLFSNPLASNIAFHAWEVPPVSVPAGPRTYDIGIVLGGALRGIDHETGRVVYGNGVDRIMQAVDLYHDGRIRKILITGGSGFVLRRDIRESELLREVILDFGIPEKDIMIETRSRNTYENALYSTGLIRERAPGSVCLLITSGYHMRRSLACFKKAGLDADPYSVDPRATSFSWNPDRIIVPGTDHLLAWDLLIHEWAGYAAYLLAGYL